MSKAFEKWWNRKGKSDAEILATARLGVSVPMAKFIAATGYEAGWKDAKAKLRAKKK